MYFIFCFQFFLLFNVDTHAAIHHYHCILLQFIISVFFLFHIKFLSDFACMDTRIRCKCVWWSNEAGSEYVCEYLEDQKRKMRIIHHSQCAENGNILIHSLDNWISAQLVFVSHIIFFTILTHAPYWLEWFS